MNPRDMDAFYDAITDYTKAQAREDQSITWCVEHGIASGDTYRIFARKPIGEWIVDQDEDVRYADERSWITDAFKSDMTNSTRYPKRRPVRHEELQTGDTAQLDSFLAGFVK